MLTWSEVDTATYPDTATFPKQTAQCVKCGRFCKVLGSSEEYDGSGTQLYVTFSCSKDGIYTESMW